MKRLSSVLACFATAALLAACPTGKPSHESEAVGWPDGDAADGKVAFKDLKCWSCHAVPSDPELLKLHTDSGEGPGPALTAETGKRPRAELLRQVALGKDPAVAVTHMGSFADTMTLRQMLDLVAFVEQLSETADGGA